MSASAGVIFHEMIFGCLTTALNMLKILVPLMIIVEILMVYNVLERLSDRLQFVSAALGMQKQSVFPLLVGVVMGVTYGAGTLLEIHRKTPIPKKDYALIGIFMFICHGIIETSFIFGVAGADILTVSLGRLVLAFAVTAAAARLPMIKRIK
ncbi:MAG TPA: nucleoside recognition domain-containing protein, partial [Anaerovoracaceae bacterium]|nr:nucleoside recognition domain-containing protein [Anaerovoracaceae bacterium]